MTHTYHAFIDESGDDGFKKFRVPGQHGGSSNWLVLSAVVMRSVNHLDAVAWRDEINKLMPTKKRREIHFKDLNHGQRLAAARVLGEKPIRCVSVLAFKPTAPEGAFSEKNQLYFYLARYLVERISWLCRDIRHRSPEGDGRVKLVFSRRGGMSYPDFQNYL